MCLVTRSNVKETVLEEDMVVWKLVQRERDPMYVYSHFQTFVYKRGKRYMTCIRKMDSPKTLEYFDDASIRPFYDDMENVKVLSLNAKSNMVSNRLKEGKLSQYDIGFHFAVEKQRLRNTIDLASMEYADLTVKITRFVVPKGAKVVFDESGLGVASEIIYSPEKYKSRLMRFRRSLR